MIVVLGGRPVRSQDRTDCRLSQAGQERTGEDRRGPSIILTVSERQVSRATVKTVISVRFGE